MNEPAPITDDTLREELSAYLDGELDAEAGLRIEQRLAADPRFARELRELQQSYELLEELSTPPVNETFAATTVEMIALEARHELQRRQRALPSARRRRWLAAAAGLLAATAGGYFLAGALLPDPNAALLRDLPVLENLDRYQQVDSLEFLEGLLESGLFAPAEAAAGRESGHAS